MDAKLLGEGEVLIGEVIGDLEGDLDAWSEGVEFPGGGREEWGGGEELGEVTARVHGRSFMLSGFEAVHEEGDGGAEGGKQALYVLLAIPGLFVEFVPNDVGSGIKEADKGNVGENGRDIPFRQVVGFEVALLESWSAGT